MPCVYHYLSVDKALDYIKLLLDSHSHPGREVKGSSPHFMDEEVKISEI